MSSPLHLAGTTTSVVIDSLGGETPHLAYWGPKLSDDDVPGLLAARSRPVARGNLDVEPPLGLVAETGRGFAGQPGITGHRVPDSDLSTPVADWSGFAPRFGDATVEQHDSAHGAGVGATVTLDDAVAGLRLTIGTELRTVESATGLDLLTVSATITNVADTPYVLDRLAPSIQLPHHAAELLTFTGRWTLEFQTERHPWHQGAWVSENRKGRTSHDRIPALFAGTIGFTETTGEVWGLQLGWSGNNRVMAERLWDGRRHIQLGELLLPGEIVLDPGQSYTTPSVYGSYSDKGLTPISDAFHALIRSRPHHPGPDRPRPVGLNTWEAVYFDHDLDTLRRLADRAAQVGVERFVLDDGWFVGRNDDTSALGDWTVDPAKYPDGLKPLIDHVTGLGMSFGIWVEPEMINPDSDLYRANPDWALQDGRYPHALFRNQLTLDLTNPKAWAHIMERLDVLLADNDISYVKWDMNRDAVQPTSGPEGEERAGAHEQMLAVYRLLDELRVRHPDVEIESCASGGARADAEILARTERIWTSDSNDAIDRQTIQRGFSLLFPPEIMGSHIGPPVSHTTGRNHDLALRASSAMLGHLGIEWNLLDAGEEDLAQLADLIAVHKRHRALIHGGRLRRIEHPDPTVSAMGVVSTDGDEALVVIVRLASSTETFPGPIRIPDLAADRSFTVLPVALPGPSRDRGIKPPPWLADAADGRDVTITGRALDSGGLALPAMDPDSALVLHVSAR